MKFIYIYTGGGGIGERPSEETETIMAAWGAWYGKLGEKVVDGGAPFGQRTTLGGGGPSAATGYTIIEASDLKAAETLAADHPHLADGGGIEICECVDMGG